jgi:hypothetical protein
MFPWAVHALVGVLVFRSGTVAGELADVGKGVQQSEFGLDQFWVVEGQAATQGGVLREQYACAVGAHVVTEDRCAKFGQPRKRFGARVRVLGSRLGPKLNPRRCFGRRNFTGLIEAQQCRTRIDLAVDRGEDFPNAACGWRPQSGFHLHAFENHKGATGLYLVAHGNRHGNNYGRSRGTDKAGLVLADAVTDAVHFNEEPRGTSDRDDMEALVAKGESTLVFTEPFDVDDQFAVVSNDSVAARTDLSDDEAVGLALVVEFHLPADGVGGTRSATARRCQETGTFAAFFGFVRVDRGSDERDVGHWSRPGRRSSAGAVEPAGVGRG